MGIAVHEDTGDWAWPEPDDNGDWPACRECRDPADDFGSTAHAACGTFDCPGECGRVIAVPALACAGCAAWVAQEDESERRDAAEREA